MVVESKTDAKVQLEVDPSYFAERVSLRPLDYRQHVSGRIGGHYRLAVPTGLVTGVAAGGALLSLQWTNPEVMLVLLRAFVSATVGVAFGTAQETSVDIVRVNSFSAPNTGGTAISLVNSNRLSPDMQPLGAADLRVATTAALGGGTGTEEGFAFGASILSLGNAVGASASGTLFDATAGQEHPALFGPNSGFRIRNLFAQGATGEIRFNVTLVLAALPTKY